MSDESMPDNDTIPTPEVEPPKVNGNGDHPETITDRVQSARESIPVGEHGLTAVTYDQHVTMAKDYVRAQLMLPTHLHGNIAVMTALVGLAARFNLDPVMLASQTYVPPGSTRLAFQSQAFGAILYGSGLLFGRLNFRFSGEGDQRTCTVEGRFKDDPGTICEATTPPLKDIHPGYSDKEGKQHMVKGSPLWDKDPEQQLAYFAQRRWIRRFAPDACMGMYTDEEVREIDQFRAGRGETMTLTADRLGQLNTGEGWGDGSHVTMDLAAIQPELPEDDPEPPTPTRKPPARPVQKAKVVVRPRTAAKGKAAPAGRQKPGKATAPSRIAVLMAAKRAEDGPRRVQDRSAPPRWLDYVSKTEAWIKKLDADQAEAAEHRWEGERELRDGIKVPMGERSRLRAILDRKLNQFGKREGDAAWRLVRPHIPIKTRIEVIARQLASAHKLMEVLWTVSVFPKPTARLEYLIHTMFGTQNVHLDHDPPLNLREIVDAEKGIYKPAANDPNYLIYRTVEDHRVKTFVRGDGAQHSDAAKRRMAIKAKRKQTEPPRPSQWPKGRKIQSRPFRRQE